MRDAIETLLAVAVIVALVVTGRPGPDLISAPPPRAYWVAFSG